MTKAATASQPAVPVPAAPTAPARARVARAGSARASDRGGRTREQILRATLEIIAAHGLSGVSHRAIAAKADVRLSLTSYHFGSLEDLLEAAFDAYHAHTELRRTELVARVDQQMGQLPTQLTPAVLTAIADTMSDTLAAYIHAGVREHRTDLAVECSFLFAWNLSPTLRHKVDQHSKGLVQLAARVFARLDSRAPEVDSAVLLATIRQLEFTQVSTGVVSPVADIKLSLFRLLLGLLLARDTMPPAAPV
ncbi:TetR/AcrR family transcriptional regulator [Rugamonas apoptosis]|uniref:TetR family transcriptional regulator n=1 Tax=Rugamonas apoptosis TaxID=2758570 RepID=A0A7W2F7Y3_9BURK|nr:TetR family transcriptional regulator [Rugamonas apoptosis]MBA5686782.1 TetR family transcriptional regulator [Rugamonas apoptosis]